MRIKDTRIFRGITVDELCAVTGIDYSRMEDIEDGDADITDEEYAVLSDALQVDGSFLSNTVDACYICVMPVQYTFTDGMLAGYGEETQLIYPKNIEFYHTYAILSDDNYYIADTDFSEETGVYILETDDGYYAASKEEGKYYDINHKELEGKPRMRIIMQTRSLEDIMAEVIDDVRHGDYIDE